MLRFAAWVVLVFLSLVGAPRARAQEEPDASAARARFESATEHYETGDYALALRGFEEAHALLVQAHHPNAPLVLFNVARCHVQLGRPADAVAAFERFLDEAPAGAPNVEVARTELQELRARVSLDDQPGGGISPVGPIVAVVGAAAMVAGAVTGGLALAAQSDATQGCADGHCPAELASRADEAQLLANVTDGLLFGGLAVAAAGLVLVFVLPSEGGEASASAGCSPDGCGVAFRGSF